VTSVDSPERTAEPLPADPVLAAAVSPAREAAAAVAGGAVDGDHLGVRAEASPAGDGFVATHAFAATVPGYVGWHWAVTVARAADSESVTVDEVELLPGVDALLAPAWVPWEERVRPGDLGPGDLLPPRPDDPRLVPAYVVDDPVDEAENLQMYEVGFELGLGRERVMSRDGRLDAADRWQTGDHGPKAAMAKQAPGACGTCGFLLPLAGSLRAGFGVCGNEVTDTDGQVVSVEYGCGAHSQVQLEAVPLTDVADVVYDDGEQFEVRDKPVETDAGDDAVSDGAAQPAVAEHDRPAGEAEDGAGETRPEPDAMIVAAEPTPEGQ
jgi:hypothetical protein